jgi:MFS family permease
MAVAEAEEALSIGKTPRDTLWTVPFTLILIAGLADTLSLTALFPVLPKFARTLSGSNGTMIGIILAAFNFSALIVRPLSGLASDKWGRRPLLCIGPVVAVIALLGLTVGQQLAPWMVVCLRILHGAGEAAFYVSAVALLTDIAPSSRRGEAISLYSVVFLCGLAIGPALGEAVSKWGYSAVWALAAVGAALSAVFALFAIGLMPATELPSGQRAETKQHRATIPVATIFPGLLFAASLFGYAGFAGFIVLFAIQQGIGEAGWLFTAYGLSVGVMRLIGVNWPDRFGPEHTGSIALLTATAGLTIIGISSDRATLLLGVIIFAAGQALCFPSFLMIALRGSSDRDRGARVGVFSSFLDIGVSLGSLVFGLAGETLGYSGGFVIAAVVDFLAALFLLGPMTYRRA